MGSHIVHQLEPPQDFFEVFLGNRKEVSVILDDVDIFYGIRLPDVYGILSVDKELVDGRTFFCLVLRVCRFKERNDLLIDLNAR